MPKKPAPEQQIVPLEVIERRIYLIRERKVMLDSDLAELYQAGWRRAAFQALRLFLTPPQCCGPPEQVPTTLVWSFPPCAIRSPGARRR